MYKTAPVSTTLYGGFNLKSLHWAWGTSYHGSSTAINLSPTWCNRLPHAPLSYIQCHSIFISVSLSTAFSLTCINIATFISFLVLNSSFLRAPTGPQQRTLMLSETNKTNLFGVQPHWVKKKKVAKLIISFFLHTDWTPKSFWDNLKHIQASRQKDSSARWLDIRNTKP